MKIFIYLTIFISVCSTGSFAQELSGEQNATLTKDQLDAYKEQAVRSIHDLEKYIQVIAEKKSNTDQKNNAVDLAIDLFQSDTTTVQVSSPKTAKINSYTIKRYLNNLKYLPYSAVKIDWYEVYLCSDFLLGTDGNYYGTATFLQKFEGTTKNELGTYRDVTKKRIQIILKNMKGVYQGTQPVNTYILKLGDIKVEEQR